MTTLASIIAADPVNVLCDGDDLGQSVTHRVGATDTAITAVVANQPGGELDGQEFGGRWSETRKMVAAPSSVWSPDTRSKVIIDSLEYDVETVETDSLGSMTIASVVRRERINRGRSRD